MTIATVRFPKSLKYVSPAAGFHTMKQIMEYVVPAENTKYEVDNGALIDIEYRTVVSLPRFWQGAPTYSLSLAKTDKIGAYAFAGTQFIGKVNIPEGYSSIGDYAFSKSMIGGMTLPSTVNFPGKEGVGLFEGCPALTRIAVGHKDFEVPAYFAKDCPVLNKVEFAAPSVYVVTQTVYPFQVTPLDRLFSAAANFSLEPVFYCDAFTPAFYSLLDKATYYIPANTRDRYPEGDAEVREMFSASIRRNGGGVTFESYPLLPQLKMSMVKFNDDRIVDIGHDGGREVIDYPFDEIETVTVYYKIAGNILATKYPAAVLLAASTGIGDVERQTPAIKCTGRRVDLGIECAYTVATPSGTVVATGRASSFTLDSPGLYIITALHGSHRSTAKLSIR